MIMKGWECPVCGRGVAPWQPECSCQTKKPDALSCKHEWVPTEKWFMECRLCGSRRQQCVQDTYIAGGPGWFTLQRKEGKNENA